MKTILQKSNTIIYTDFMVKDGEPTDGDSALHVEYVAKLEMLIPYHTEYGIVLIQHIISEADLLEMINAISEIKNRRPVIRKIEDLPF